MSRRRMMSRRNRRRTRSNNQNYFAQQKPVQLRARTSKVSLSPSLFAGLLGASKESAKYYYESRWTLLFGVVVVVMVVGVGVGVVVVMGHAKEANPSVAGSSTGSGAFLGAGEALFVCALDLFAIGHFEGRNGAVELLLYINEDITNRNQKN